MRRFPIFVVTVLVALSWTHASFRAQQDQAAPNEPASSNQPSPTAAGNSYDGPRYYSPGAAKCVEIGRFYLRRGKYQGALSRFEEARDIDPNYAPAYLGLGRVYEKIGLKRKALDAYQKYLDALPSDKDAMEAKGAQAAIARLEKELKVSHPQASKN